MKTSNDAFKELGDLVNSFIQQDMQKGREIDPLNLKQKLNDYNTCVVNVTQEKNKAFLRLETELENKKYCFKV